MDAFPKTQISRSPRTIDRTRSAPAKREDIALVHTPPLLAAGGTLGCSRAVWAGEAANAFAIVRSPGHHAEPARVMGFCLFNDIAIAAQDALERGLSRVVVDYDVHHNNRTQAGPLNMARRCGCLRRSDRRGFC